MSTMQRLNSKIHDFSRGIIPIFVAMAFVFTSVLAMPAPKASAFTGDRDECSAEFFAFDWKKAVKDDFAHYGITLDPNAWTGNIFIYGINPPGTTPNNQTVRVAFGYGDFYFTQNGLTGNKQIRFSAGSYTAGYNTAIIRLDKDTGTAGNQPGINNFEIANQFYPQGSEFDTSSEGTCFSTAKGAIYQNTWTGKKYNDYMPANGADTCSGFDVACYVNKGFTTVADTFKDVGSAIIQWIASLFMPDATAMQTLFQNQQTFWQNKLGFLLYPFELLGDLFNALTNNTGWCGSSACSLSFGSWYGAPFAINFAYLNTVAPPLWVAMLAVLRATVVVVLIIAIKHKYDEVMHK